MYEYFSVIQQILFKKLALYYILRYFCSLISLLHIRLISLLCYYVSPTTKPYRKLFESYSRTFQNTCACWKQKIFYDIILGDFSITVCVGLTFCEMVAYEIVS